MFNKTEYQREYRRTKLKRISLDIPIEAYQELKTHTEQTHETVNGFIKRAISETMKRDNETD